MCNLKIATYNNEGNRRRLNIYRKEHELTVVTKQLMPNNICQKPTTRYSYSFLPSIGFLAFVHVYFFQLSEQK